MTNPRVLILAGLGDDAAAWEPVTRALPSRWSTRVLTLAELSSLERFDADEAVATIARALQDAEGPTHLVGLSAGAMIALRLAARRTAARIRGARLQVVDGARHEWHRTMPEQFARLVRAHVEGV